MLDAQARAQIGAGDLQSAIATYKRAYQFAPNSTDILSRYVFALNKAKDFVEAQSVLRAALNRAPQNLTIKADLIRVAAEIGGVDAGLAEARDLAKKDPDSTIYDQVSAELLNKAGRSKEAIGLLKSDLAAKPANDGLINALAQLYSSAGYADKAETLLSARVAADPTNYVVASALASLYLEKKNYDAAISQYTKILDQHPVDPGALNNLAWLYQQKGDLNKAQGLAERAAAAAPECPADRRYARMDSLGPRRRRQSGDLLDRSQCLGPHRSGDRVSLGRSTQSIRAFCRRTGHARKAARLRSCFCRQGPGRKAARRTQAQLIAALRPAAVDNTARRGRYGTVPISCSSCFSWSARSG